MAGNTDSVFELITNLCEHYYYDPKKIKAARTKCYEILLKKRFPNHNRDFRDFKGLTDPFCKLLVWHFELGHRYQFKSYAENLQKLINERKFQKSDKDTCSSVLEFLLSLRNLPPSHEKVDVTSSSSMDNSNKIFQLPNNLKIELSQYSGKNYDPIIFFKAGKKNEHFHSNKTSKGKLHDKPKEVGSFPHSKSLDTSIWEVVAKLKYSDRRNWENYGYSEPDKEPPFLSELGDLSSLWVDNLESLYIASLFKDGIVFKSKMISRKAFLRNLKYLLVGMVSETFTFDGNGEFYSIPGFSVEGITPDSLNLYCSNLLFCGTCFKALHKMSTPNPDTGQYKYKGYIFTEFCESIRRYLEFYQTAVFSIEDSTTFLEFQEKTYRLQQQISALTSICKVGPFTNDEDVPHGVALLNYLYQKVLMLTEQNVIIVLYSILFPCCQVYFSRFLKQWFLEGAINDPYGEFFIKTNSKYILSRGRTYWTRSYTLREDIVPDFLVDLKLDILSCGKKMNLLKFCDHGSKLCLYLMGKKPPIISCCLTLDQLNVLQQNATSYYLEVCSECGPRFKMSHVLMKSHEEDPVFMQLIAKKRNATLKRIQLERKKIEMEHNERKFEEICALKEQYDAALEQKQLRMAIEIEDEIKLLEENLEIELKRQKLVQEESKTMIDYYSHLIEIADNRKAKIESNIKKMKSIHMEHHSVDRDKDQYKSVENLDEQPNSSNDSFYSVPEEAGKAESTLETSENVTEIAHVNPHINSSDCMDILNANATEQSNDSGDKNANTNVISQAIQQAIDNFEIARKNKHRVMTEELGFGYKPIIKKTADSSNIAYLTEAQKNKLRVLSSEFGVDFRQGISTNRLSTAGLINRNKVMGISDCFVVKQLDNERFINKNVKNIEESTNKIGTIKRSKSLVLDLNKDISKTENEKPAPMSVDSTPLSDMPPTPATTPSTMFLSVDTNQLESIPNTAEIQQLGEGFNFNRQIPQRNVPIFYNRSESTYQNTVFSKHVTRQEAAGVSTNCLKLFLHESINIPLTTQTKLVNDELLKFFINDLDYLKHLSSLRDYFFLQDGEFGRHITENLFTKLYDANFPVELINCRTLQDLVFGALDRSNKSQENSGCLSFKINSLPNCFDLGNPDVLDCLSLTYKIAWPLNILLPTDTVSKYDEVFKFLIKLNRVSWALKKMFLELKILAKETGKKAIYLMSSPQYMKLHQCRHIMTQFIQTLQSYVVGEVLQSSWAVFEKNLSNITSFDDLYSAHTVYIKNILFMCLLNQRTAVLRSILHKIFVVILKFYDYLRSRCWTCEDGNYVHPNFNKLESIFRNFQEFVLYFFKVVRKVAKSGYQPHLNQLLDLLDLNEFMSESLRRSQS